MYVLTLMLLFFKVKSRNFYFFDEPINKRGKKLVFDNLTTTMDDSKVKKKFILTLKKEKSYIKPPFDECINHS